jgi:hypothetical protein
MSCIGIGEPRETGTAIFLAAFIFEKTQVIRIGEISFVSQKWSAQDFVYNDAIDPAAIVIF